MHLGVGLPPAHGLLKDVEPAGLDGDAEGMPVLPVLETPGGDEVKEELLLYLASMVSTIASSLGSMAASPAARRIGDDRPHVPGEEQHDEDDEVIDEDKANSLVLGVLGVEELAGTEGVGQRVLVRAQVAVHLGGQVVKWSGGQVERCTGGEVVG